ncbi:MAG TPA: L,D-transpeptidase [Hyphomicrobiaceae bacterium]|nr:L,D-transpeptidase [Hyphomicrobiaceae bacterium]
MSGVLLRIEFDFYRKSLWSCLLAALIIAGPFTTVASAQIFFWPWNDGWGGGRRPGAWDYRGRPDYMRRAPRPGGYERAQRPRHDDDEIRGDREAAARGSQGPLVAIVSLSDQRIFVYGSEGLIARSVVSTGQPGYRTPTGVFSVIQKNRYHESNIYSGAPMPWMHRITWSGIALHGGVVPRYPASHGCIRLTYDFAPRLWAMSRVGMRVIVAPHEVEPVAITHPRLPLPAMTPIPPTASGEKEPPRSAELDTPARVPTQPVTLTDKSPIAAAATAVRMQNPLERARALRAKAIAAAAAAEKASTPAVALARRTAAEARTAAAAVRRARATVALAERRLAAASHGSELVKTAGAVDAASKTEEAARQALDEARKALTEAMAAEEKASADAFAASAAARQVLSAKEEVAEALKASVWGLEPVSVFVSRKEGRIFLRQGFNQLLDAPVSIREPERALGTHVFTAMAAEDGGATLRWSVVSVPDGGSHGASAAEALDRIEVPKDVEDEIADRLWAGASLIISDQGISNETGQGTDFVVLTKY